MSNAMNIHASNLNVEERMALMKKLAWEAGLRLPDTILPEGHALWESGEQSRRKLERTLAQMPSVEMAMAGLSERIKLEKPEDAQVKATMVRMDPRNGRLYGEGQDADKALGYTPSGFSQVTSFVRPNSVRQGYPSVLLSLPPSLRSEVFNYHAKNARDSGEEVTVRTIVEPASGQRVIRAVTSSRHSLETGDDAAVVQALHTPAIATSIRGAKARITREQTRSEFEIIWPAMERQLVVGDICYIGIRIRNSETKHGSLEVEAFVLRILCANFTTAFSRDRSGETISIRHMGDLRVKLVEAFERALKRASPFVAAFADAYKHKFPEGKTRGELLSMVEKKHQLPGYLLESASQLWDADGLKSAGDTLAGLVNALTRASQSQDIDDATMTERVAGDLVSRKWAALS